MIELVGINKYFARHHVLKDIHLKVETGEVVAILGPSGSGKSTLLRCINFLERPNGGTIQINGLKVDAEKAGKKDIHALRTSTAMVFQHYNLFKNKSVLQNVMLGLTVVKKMERKEAREVSERLLEKVGLSHRLNYYPLQLSGGEQQRVAIARALSLNPEVLLFDEPTSALDPELVEEVLTTIKRVAAEGNTMLIVTHEMGFAKDVADRIVLMDNGEIIEEGPTLEIFTNPREERTRKFLRKSLQYRSYEPDLPEETVVKPEKGRKIICLTPKKWENG